MLFGLYACSSEEVTRVGGRSLDRDKSVQVFIQTGMEYIKENKPEAAQRHLDRALELNPHSAEAHNALAMLYRQTDDLALEEQHLKQALRENSAYSQARNNYGSFLYRQGKYKAALEQLTLAAEDTHYERRALAYENMGYCLVRLNRLDAAAEAFKKALLLDSTLINDYLELAQIALVQQQLPLADQYFKKFGATQRHTAHSLWLGIQIARGLDLKDDLASYELALKNLYPNSAEYQFYQRSLASPKP